jgi:cobalt-precorrin 5A hydrolase
MKAAILAFSARGFGLGVTLRDYFAETGREASLTRCGEGDLSDWTQKNFTQSDALIFVGSCGIAVRAIAPFVKSKLTDPAVIVLDECGTYCVSLLSGHLGGANALTKELSGRIGSVAVITTATDRAGVFAIDDWAREAGIKIVNPERIKWTSARLLCGEVLKLHSLFPVEGDLPDGMEAAQTGYDILVTWRTRGRREALRLVPPVVTLGVGSRRGMPEDAIEEAFVQMLQKSGCHPAAIRQVCSIDLKKDEPGILSFCERHNLPFYTYSAEQLNGVEGVFNASAFVQQVAGVDNVCERSALLGSGEGGRLITGKTAGNGITMALAISPYTVRFDNGRT